MDIITWFSLLGGCLLVFFICIVIHTAIRGVIKKIKEVQIEKACGQDAENVSGILPFNTVMYIRLWSSFFIPYKSIGDGFIGYIYYVPESPHTRHRIISYTKRVDSIGLERLYAVLSDGNLISVTFLRDYYCTQKGQILGIAPDVIERKE